MDWRKLNRILHRDIGYFFFGMTIIYALSGIALNHIDDWDPSYRITVRNFRVDSIPVDQSNIDRAFVERMVERLDDQIGFKNYYFPEPGVLKVFIENGNVEVDLASGTGKLEKTEKRIIFYHINLLHYNPGKWWTWFSDIFAVGLFTIAITGLFMIQGKKGITGRGAWFTTAGILIPLLILILYTLL